MEADIAAQIQRERELSEAVKAEVEAQVASEVAAELATAPTTMAALLRSVGLGKYDTNVGQSLSLAQLLTAMRNDGRAACDTMLRDAGVSSIGHRMRLLNALDSLVARPS